MTLLKATTAKPGFVPLRGSRDVTGLFLGGVGDRERWENASSPGTYGVDHKLNHDKSRWRLLDSGVRHNPCPQRGHDGRWRTVPSPSSSSAFLSRSAPRRFFPNPPSLPRRLVRRGGAGDGEPPSRSGCAGQERTKLRQRVSRVRSCIPCTTRFCTLYGMATCRRG